MQSQTEKAALTITPKILNSYGTTSNQEIQLWASRKIPLTIMMVRDLVKVLGPLNPLEQGYADFGITTLTASLSTCVTQLEAGDHDQIMFAFIEALNQCVHALERSPSTIITTFPCIPTHAEAAFKHQTHASKRVKPTAKLFNPEGERVEALDGDLFECPEESIHPNLRSAKPAEDLVSTPHKLVIPPEVLVLPPEEPVIPPRVLVLCPEELFIPPEVLGKATETVLKSPAYSVQFAEDSVKLPDLDQIKTEEEDEERNNSGNIGITTPVVDGLGAHAALGNSQIV
ncbi:hypothetical protein H4Q26_003094 [Puccinia striiformis f. sp. tritici PST-130]|nr:hypothetical protein H4Q26_003094 [Puccinia striiformis f. sp. tritici PST-130]